MRNPAARAKQRAKQIDYSIHQHAIRASCGTYPAQHERMFHPTRDRMVGLSAIGQSRRTTTTASRLQCRRTSLRSSSNSKCKSKSARPRFVIQTL
jgi:hypothetical protein